MTDAYIGIDLCFAKKKRLPISICTWQDGKLIPEALKKLPIEPPRGSGNAAVLDRDTVEAFTRNASFYISEACKILSVVPRRIAIDAPSAPRKEGTRRRAAEIAMDKAGISCFTTPTSSEFERIFDKVRHHLSNGGPENRIPHANQLWMNVGFSLFQELKNIADCIEVFPQAIARVMGAGQVHKSQAGGVDAQLDTVSKYTGWPCDTQDKAAFADIAFAPDHDRLDAYLSAWVAALEETDRKAFGVPPKDVIWTPRLKNISFPVPSVIKSSAAKAKSQIHTPTTSARAVKFCPACGQSFKRWPLGWDAHAAHTCTGLDSKEPETRKAEFKQKFGRLFG